MKLRFESFFRGYLLALVALLCWSIRRVAAQNATNQTNTVQAVLASGTGTNQTAALDPAREKPLRKPMVTPEWIENLARELPFLKFQLWGNELWKYLFSLIYIFLAFYVSKFLDYLTRVWLKKWAEKTETKFDDLLLELLNGPVKVVAFMIFLRIGLDVFQWPEMVQKVLS